MIETKTKTDANTPAEMLSKLINSSVSKTNLKTTQLLLLSFLAGMYIAFGALFASVIAIGMPGVWPYGIMKVLQGLVFSIGLILVVIGGAELFTGNSLMIAAYLNKKISLIQLFRNWIIVFFGNFLGSLTVSGLILLSKEYLVSNGTLGTIMVSTALGKLQYGFWQALALGILCNILVCLAVWLTLSGRSVADKIFAIIFPITAFIAAGFEHSVANMYIIPMGILIKIFDPNFSSSLTINLELLSWESFFIHNLLPVTIGNIIGGTIFVGLIYFVIYKKEISS